jgi:Na+-driven multidrug efflux pump
LTGFLCSSRNDSDDGDDISFFNHTSYNTTSNGDDDYEGECVEVEVYSIVSNTMVLVYFLSAGFSWGAATQVGNLLGAGDYKTAALSCKVLLVLVLCISGSVALTLLTLRHEWGAMFSDSVKVQEMVAKLLFFVAGYIVLDACKWDTRTYTHLSH